MLMSMRLLGGLAAITFVGALAMADAQKPNLDPESFLPPAPAWSGASEKLIAQPGAKWITPAEPALISSPSFDDTIAYLRKVDAASALVRMETFATTPQGRKLQAV